jgi:xylulokinase
MNEAAQGSWQIFNELLESTPRGNFGNFALYFDMLEILPSIFGDYRYNKSNDEISRYSSKEVEVRALIEGQFVAKRAHAEDFGFVIGKSSLRRKFLLLPSFFSFSLSYFAFLISDVFFI